MGAVFGAVFVYGFGVLLLVYVLAIVCTMASRRTRRYHRRRR